MDFASSEKLKGMALSLFCITLQKFSILKIQTQLRPYIKGKETLYIRPHYLIIVTIMMKPKELFILL